MVKKPQSHKSERMIKLKGSSQSSNIDTIVSQTLKRHKKKTETKIR